MNEYNYMISLTFTRERMSLIDKLMTYISENESVLTIDKCKFYIKIDLYGGYYRLYVEIHGTKAYKKLTKTIRIWQEETR